jgi:hypothetical protein
VRLSPGLNRLSLIPLANPISASQAQIPVSRQLLYVESLSLASHYSSG